MHPEILKGERHQPGGDLLAGRDDDVVFARIVDSAHLPCPFDQLIGRAGHRRHDDRDLVAGIDLVFDPAGGVLDPLDISDRGSAEFLNDARHASLVMG